MLVNFALFGRFFLEFAMMYPAEYLCLASLQEHLRAPRKTYAIGASAITLMGLAGAAVCCMLDIETNFLLIPLLIISFWLLRWRTDREVSISQTMFLFSVSAVMMSVCTLLAIVLNAEAELDNAQPVFLPSTSVICLTLSVILSAIFRFTAVRWSRWLLQESLLDAYNQTAIHPISYAVGYDISCKNHYYLIMDLLKMADQKMYQDKHYKKSLTAHPDRLYSQNRLVESISTDSLKEKISTILTNSCRNKQYAFLMTDVDNFHLINDYWGYETGTAILNFLFKKMELFPQTVFVNRYHSDVFACIVDITGQNQQSFREKVIRYNKQTSSEILEAYPVNYLFLNTGIYYLEGTEISSEELISHTNIVRRKAKTELSGVCEYSEDIARDEQKRAETIHTFRNALEQKEFQLYFQPKINGKSQQISSAEVLVRWQKNDGSLWFPDSFLPILEETGEVEALDYYVYEAAFLWLSERMKKQQKIIPLSLNVSPIHFRKINTFIHKVSDLIDKYKIPSQYLIFEITETTYIHNIDAVNQMIRFFQKKNIRISMDDFGSGYSSLNTLKDILFDEVKIDKRFLDDDLSEKGKIVLQEIFHLLKRTNKLIVCEGVETKEMVDFLVQEDCDELQGYYYYKPLEMHKFEALIA